MISSTLFVNHCEILSDVGFLRAEVSNGNAVDTSVERREATKNILFISKSWIKRMGFKKIDGDQYG